MSLIRVKSIYGKSKVVTVAQAIDDHITEEVNSERRGQVEIAQHTADVTSVMLSKLIIFMIGQGTLKVEDLRHVLTESSTYEPTD